MPRRSWLDGLATIGKNCLAGTRDGYVVIAVRRDVKPYGYNPEAQSGPTARIATTGGFRNIDGIRVSLNAIRDADPVEIATANKANARRIKARARRA